MKLSETSEKIMPLMAQGYSNEEIAKMLNLSSHTVKWHVARIIRLLNAKNRTHAACIFRELEYEIALLELYNIDISTLKIPPLS